MAGWRCPSASPLVLALLAARRRDGPARRPAAPAPPPSAAGTSAEQRAVRDGGRHARPRRQAFHGERPLAGRELPDALAAFAAGARRRARPGAGRAPCRSPPSTALLVTQLGPPTSPRPSRPRPAAPGCTRRRLRHRGRRALPRPARQPPVPRDEELELYPRDAITRAEAAHSFARRAAVAAAARPRRPRRSLAASCCRATTRAQLRVLRIAVVEDRHALHLGRRDRRHRRVRSAARRTAAMTARASSGGSSSSRASRGRRIRGRTAAQQAGEIRSAARIRLDDVRPGDLLFFGPAASGRGHRAPHRARGDRAEHGLGDPRLRAGRVRLAARRTVARGRFGWARRVL